jgi:DNA-binding protein YbaB
LRGAPAVEHGLARARTDGAGRSRVMDMEALMKSLGPMQEAMRKSAAERTSSSFSGSAGGGAVTVTLRGDLTISAVKIAPAAAAAASGDAGMLEDLIAAAGNDALRQYRQRFGATPEEQVQKLLGTSGMGAMLGPLMSMMGRRP